MTDDDQDSDEFLDDHEEFEERIKKPKKKTIPSKRSLLIRNALETHLLEYANKKNEQRRDLDELTSIIEEFADSFVLLGYNYDGEPLTLVSATTQQQADSLGTLIQKFVVNSTGRSPGSMM